MCSKLYFFFNLITSGVLLSVNSFDWMSGISSLSASPPFVDLLSLISLNSFITICACKASLNNKNNIKYSK